MSDQAQKIESVLDDVEVVLDSLMDERDRQLISQERELDEQHALIADLEEVLKAAPDPDKYLGVRHKGLFFDWWINKRNPMLDLLARLGGGDECNHPVHQNPGLVAPCPECGADND